MSNILLVNITWNPTGWRNTYINPKAGHKYAQKNAGHESLNFKFDKKGIDTNKHIYGFVQWNNAPVSYEKDGLIIFYTRDTDERVGKIVGVYGKAEIYKDYKNFPYKGFKNNRYSPNIRADKEFSMLFPDPLMADDYKTNVSDRMVGQNGFAYKEIDFAESVLFDELVKLSQAGILESDYKKLTKIYEYYTGKSFKPVYYSKDEKEQEELTKLFKKTKTKKEILADLEKTKETDSEEIVVNHKTYKRDNKTIAQIKILRDFKCQLCGTQIMKKDGSFYIEAAHIKAKHKKGCETLDNILLLCPNHHKEFDFGLLVIKKHMKTSIEIILNGRPYKLNLTTR